MKISDGERLIAIMLADLMTHLEVQGEVDPSFVKSALTGGDEWALKMQYSGIFHGEHTTEEVASETGKIMSMCSVLEYSISQLPDEDLEKIPEHTRTVFVGFDGNHEDHYGVAHTLVNDMGRFNEFAERGLNSHHSTIERYRAMLRAYENTEMPMSGHYSFADIMTILEAPGRA